MTACPTACRHRDLCANLGSHIYPERRVSQFTLGPRDIDRVDRAARRAGMTNTDWLRAAIRTALDDVDAADSAAMPVGARPTA